MERMVWREDKDEKNVFKGKNTCTLKRVWMWIMACWWEKGRNREDKGTERTHEKIFRGVNCKDLRGKQMEELEREKGEKAQGRRIQ